MGWRIQTLGEACVFERGLTYSKADEVTYSRNAVLRANNIDLLTNKIDLTEIRYISDDVRVPLSKKVKRGSLIICTASGSKSHLGKVAIIEDDYEYAFGGFMGQITPRPHVDPKYLFYVMTSKEYKSFISDLSNGMNINNLKFSELQTFQIVMPSLSEQNRIVAFLDQAFEGIATAVKNAEKNLVNARELFESYLNFVLNFDDDRIPARELATLCDQSRVITYGVIKLGEEIPGGVPCLRTSNVRWLKFETVDVKCIAPSLSNDYKRTILQGGEVLVNVRGTLGGVAAVDSTIVGWNVSREVAVVPSDENKINQSYLAYWIARKASQSWLTDVQKGVAYTGINIADLRQLPVAVPDRKTQVHLVKQLHEFSQTSRRLEAVYQQKLLELAELKQSLLQKAFAGQLTADSLAAAQPKAAE